MKIDVLGLPLKEAMDIIEKNYSETNIEIKKTFAWNKESEKTLTQARVLKILEYKDNLTIITGYF